MQLCIYALMQGRCRGVCNNSGGTRVRLCKSEGFGIFFMLVQISGGQKRCTGAGVQGCSVYGCRCAKILYAGASVQRCCAPGRSCARVGMQDVVCRGSGMQDVVCKDSGVQRCFAQGARMQGCCVQGGYYVQERKCARMLGVRAQVC
jgi:hypothetical protein